MACIKGNVAPLGGTGSFRAKSLNFYLKGYYMRELTVTELNEVSGGFFLLATGCAIACTAAVAAAGIAGVAVGGAAVGALAAAAAVGALAGGVAVGAGATAAALAIGAAAGAVTVGVAAAAVGTVAAGVYLVGDFIAYRTMQQAGLIAPVELPTIG